MPELRYLIGGGEKLSEEVGRPSRGGGEKSHPYTFSEAFQRLAPQLNRVTTELESLPALACPGGDTVVALTLHPTYLAKSYYPASLIQELKLSHLGSRAVHIVPDKAANGRATEDPRPQPAPLLYLSGRRDRLRRFAQIAEQWRPAEASLRSEFRQLERVELPGDDRAKALPDKKGEQPLEVVLHADPEYGDYVIEGFEEYSRSLGLDVWAERRRQNGGLCFIPMYAPAEAVPELLKFSFLRAVRSMPRIVAMDPMIRGMVPGFSVSLPDEDAIAPDLAVAIFDGGLPNNHGLDRWVNLQDAPGVGAPLPAAQNHGLAVTSAFLFGPLEPGVPPAQPRANVDHWRVLGTDTAADDFELYSILDRIEDVLSSRRYDFVNLSLGPDSAMEDDDVNSWTSTLDMLLAEGETVATVACGNNGERDHATKLNRVQPPSDGVNMIAVGAADKMDASWRRATYSAIGPGRSPGYVKPDFITFGGSYSAPFLTLDSVAPHMGSGTQGTSFAAPLAMRSGVGVRAQFSDPLWAPTMKALLVHQANSGDHLRGEVGWGRVSHELNDLITCGDGEAHIVYQRQMPITGAVRLYLPVPPGLTGNVEIKATFCLFCDVDPEDSINYTRGGLEVQFRPDSITLPPPYHNKEGKLITPKWPASDTFFGADDFYAPEYMRRDDAQKWETTITRSKRKRASSLNAPAFDVSHISRAHGHSGGGRAQMKFALILTLRNSAVDLYDRVVTAHQARLQPMRSRTDIRITTRA
ncbi:S8 family peptidase [Mesorhizobium sp. B2-9-1]|uniref:S8 family peptidase n=1 Tax=Mesorhizobium sp. B2-9-1 TaxID=2589898 RepID=UPI00112A69F7|nr:S8 family peptidase [Mesorhizobium sp. B2-9-1]TPI50235.1 S8 family peptidase [Mesorhizobium sp. B2-9-1]